MNRKSDSKPVSSIVQLAHQRHRGQPSRVATATATHPVATIVLLTVRDRLTAWVCGPQNPIQEEESDMRKFLALGQA